MSGGWGFYFAEVEGYRLYECPVCHAVVRDESRAAHDAWHAGDHVFTGRMVGPDRDRERDAFPVVSYCACGLGFFGYGAKEADHRFDEHTGSPG